MASADPMILDCPQCGTQNRVPVARITTAARCGHCKTALSPPDHPLAVHSEADFDELIRDATVPVLVDFWAAWCGPCRAVAPELEKLAREKAQAAVVAKVDTDALPTLAARYAIRSIPTIVLFRDGREAKRLSGAMSAAQIASGLAL